MTPLFPVFAWERTLQPWIARVSAPLLPVLRGLNMVLGGTDAAAVFVPLYAVWPTLFARWLGADLSLWPPAIIAVAMLAEPRITLWVRLRVNRARPGDDMGLLSQPGHWQGLPSSDCAQVTIWTLPVLGWWSAIPVLVVVWARLARAAHWPLDTLGGVAVGVLLVGAVLLT